MDDRDPQTFAIIGAALEVHNCPGVGFLEAVYRHAAAIELTLRAIPHTREPELVVRYKDRAIGSFRPDFLCYGDVIVEVKGRPRWSRPTSRRRSTTCERPARRERCF